MWRARRVDTTAVAILVAGALAYLNAVGASFQFDDWNVIVADARVQSLAAWLDAMPGIRPVLKLSYALNHASGLGAPGFHAVNILIHLTNGLLVLALLRRWPAGHATGSAAALAALIFVLHPVQTEAVTYASGRSVSLSACFALASLLAWVAGRERRTALLSAVLSPALFALALGTRETAVVLPLALVLWRATAGTPPGDRASALRATAPHWVVLVVVTAFALALADYQRFFATSLGVRPLSAQLLTQVDAVAYLLGQLLRPDRLNVDPMLPVIVALTPAVALRALLLALVLTAGLASLRRRPALVFGLLWFLLWLAPTNSVLPRFDVANDRQLYLALLGPAWLAGLGVVRLSAGRHRMTVAAGVVAAVVLGLATAGRNRVYADERAFWQDVIAKTPGNARAHGNLGYALALAGRDREAEQALRQALAIDPGYTRAGVNLALLRQGLLVDKVPATDSVAGSPRASSP